MICETYRLGPDCELDPPKKGGETCPYIEPKERLQLKFAEERWKMRE